MLINHNGCRNHRVIQNLNTINLLTVMCILVGVKSFPRFWRNHQYCRNKWYLIWKPLVFSLRWSKKKKNLEKKAFFVFLGCFWAYVGQPHDHIGWATSMPFASINPTNPRTNPWNFGGNCSAFGGGWKTQFFWVGHFEIFFFASFLFKSITN